MSEPIVARTGENVDASGWYLIISTARVFALVEALHGLENPSPEALAECYREFDSEVLE